MKITISEIKVNPGRRPINLDGISELAQSISEIGLLNPITIDQEHILVAGLHRLEAAKLLGWTEIECNVCSLDTLQTELAEIDENVVRTELSVIEYGELLERRKEIYESLHPETKAGQAQAAGMNRAIGNNISDKMSVTLKSFAQDTADKLGVSPRTVERTVQMMNGLTEDAREVFRHFPNYKLSQSNAMKLSRMEPGKQKTAAILLASGQIRSLDEYQPVEGRTAPGRSKLSRQQKVEFLESVADLKDPTKDCRQSPEAFILEYSAFIERVQRGVESFHLPNYKEVLPALSQEQLHTLMGLTDSCRKTLEDYLSFVKEAIDGYIVQLQIKELDECAKLLRYTSNNVNQIARRVNSGGGVYPDEVDEICGKLTEASGLFGNILEQLSKIK